MRASTTYYLYDAFGMLGLASTVTVYTPFLLSIGLSFAEVALINTAFWFTIILMEIPTGMLADGKSRVWSLKMGCACFTLGGILYTLATGFWIALIAEVCIGIGASFFSGAEQAWITDALHREGRDKDRKDVFATGSFIRGCVMLLGGFVGSWIASVDMRSVWLPLAVMTPIAWWIVHRHMNGKGEPIVRMSEGEALRASVIALRASRALKWVIAAEIVIGGVVAFNHFWVPYFSSQVDSSEIPFLWAIIYIGFTGAALFIRRMTIVHGNEGSWIIASLALSGLGLFATAISTNFGLSVCFVIVHEFGRGMFAPLVDSFVQHRIESGYRATFVSLKSLLGRLGLAIVPLFIWLFIHEKPNSLETIQIVWVACGLFLLFGAFVLFLVRPKLNAN